MQTKKKILVTIISVIIVILVLTIGATSTGILSGKSSIVLTTVIQNPGTIAEVSSSPDPFINEFQLPNGLPNAITVDSVGNVWTVLQNSSSLGEFSPLNDSFHEYPIPGLGSKAPLTSWGIAVDNNRHLVWFTEEITNTVWSFQIQSQTFKMYQIATPGSNPYQVALDPKGNAWFTEFTGDKLGVVLTNGTVDEFPIPIASSNPTGIAVNQNTGRIWFNLLDTSGAFDQFYVGSFLNGSFTFNNITPDVDTPVGIAIDSAGNIWMTQHGASFFSEFNPVTHYFRTISTSIPSVGESLPYFVYVDSATGLIWFNEHYGNTISVFNPNDSSLVEYVIPSRATSDGNISGALTMTLSPSGTPWFTELYTGKIGEVNPNAPIGLGIKVSQGVVELGNETSIPLQLTITSSSNATTYLSAAVGNFTGTFNFNFTEFSGNGNYSTMMTIQNGGSPPGVYFATISVESENTIVSQVIEINTE